MSQTIERIRRNLSQLKAPTLIPLINKPKLTCPVCGSTRLGYSEAIAFDPREPGSATIRRTAAGHGMIVCEDLKDDFTQNPGGDHGGVVAAMGCLDCGTGGHSGYLWLCIGQEGNSMRVFWNYRPGCE